MRKFIFTGFLAGLLITTPSYGVETGACESLLTAPLKPEVRAEVEKRLEKFMKEVRTILPAGSLPLIVFRLLPSPANGGPQADAISSTIQVALPQELLESATPSLERERIWRETFVALAHEVGHLVMYAELFERQPELFLQHHGYSAVEAQEEARLFEQTLRNRLPHLTPEEKTGYGKVLRGLKRVSDSGKTRLQAMEAAAVGYEQATALNEFYADVFAGIFSSNFNAVSQSFGEECLLANADHCKHRAFDPGKTRLEPIEYAHPYFQLNLARGALARLVRLDERTSPEDKRRLVAEVRQAVLETFVDFHLSLPEGSRERKRSSAVVLELNRLLIEKLGGTRK